MASLEADRGASAAAVRRTMDGWLDAVGGDWRVTLQRDPFDFDLKPWRVDAARRARSKRWQEALEAAPSCHLLYGALDPDPRTGLGRAAFVLDASRPPFWQGGAMSPQFCLWIEADLTPPDAAGVLRRLLEELACQGRLLQAFLARWNWKPLSLGATPYETACGVGGPAALSPVWCGRYLRGVGEVVWLGPQMTSRLNRAAMQAVADLTEDGTGGWRVELRPPADLDALEKALAPVLGGREEWHQAFRI